MNKHFYRVIFSKTLQRLVVVSDITLSEGKAKSEGVGLPTLFSKVCGWSVKPLMIGLYSLLGAILVPAQAQELQIRADNTAPTNQRPVILETANGIPQVNIQTPNSKGMSYNKYQQFDVDTRGAILNNSRKNAQTELGGWVQANPYLAGGEAKLIVNEVNASRPSQLKGYVEVAGQKADVIVANPSGIHCEGCGFINSGRTTLTTGQVQIENGWVSGYQVEKGTVSVAGRGMDSSRQDYTDIIAKEVKVNAGIWANNLKVTTGKNKVSKNNDAVQVIHTGEETAQPVGYAVDVAALGGMYAGQIHLVGTENGLGVRNAGHIGASVGEVSITTEGQLVNTGYIGAQQDATIQAKQAVANQASGVMYTQSGDIAITSQQQGIEQHGSLIAKGKPQGKGNIQLIAKETITQTKDSLAEGNIRYQAKRIKASHEARSASGVVFDRMESAEPKALDTLSEAGSQTQLLASEAAELHGQHLAQGKLDIQANTVTLDDATLNAYDITAISRQGDLQTNRVTAYAENLAQWSTPNALSTQQSHLRAKQHHVKAHQLNNTQGIWQYTGNTDWTLALIGGLDNTQGIIESEGSLTLQTSVLNNAKGTIDVLGSLNIDTQQGEVNNTQGIISAQQNLVIDSGRFDNTEGLVQSQEVLMIDTHQQALINQKTLNAQYDRGIVSLGSIALTTPVLQNNQGYIGARNSAKLHLSNELHNQQAEIATGKSLVIDGNYLTINNRLGKLLSGEQLTIQAVQLSGDGDVQSDGDLSVTLRSDFTAHTDIKAKKKLSFVTSGKILNKAQWISENQLRVSANHIENTEKGVFNAKDTQLTSQTVLLNRGLINSFSPTDDSLTLLKANQIENIGTGRIYGDHVALQAALLRNQDERTDEVRSAVIAARQRLDVGVKDSINQTTILDANKKGGASIYSDGGIYFGQTLDEAHHAVGQANSLQNRSATIEAAGEMVLNVKDILNSNDDFKTEIQLDSVDNTYRHYLRPKNKDQLISWDLLKWARYSRARKVVWKDNTEPTKLPENGDFAANPLPSPNSQICQDMAAEIGCQINPDSLYPPDSPVWSYFEIASPKPEPEGLPSDMPDEEDLIEPVKPIRTDGESDESFAQRQRDYEQAKQVYEENQKRYKQIMAIYGDWITETEQKYQQLGDAIEAHNRRFTRGETYYDFWDVKINKTEVKKDKIVTSKPAQILSGGDMTFNGHQFINDKSTVIAGGTLTASHAIDNIDGQGIKITTDYGTERWTYSRWRGGFKRYHERKWGRTQNYERERKESITVPVVEYRQNYDYRRLTQDLAARSVVVDNKLQLNKPIVTENAQWEIRSISVDTRLPSSSLYRINRATDSHVLIETDPAYANWRRWLSSDYMYTALRSDHNQVLKRLGDGYYEQRLVREQINQLTGRQFLLGFDDYETQYKALMDNGITFAHRFNLAPGISLSEEMVAQLTSDMVWLETQRVTLADGQQVHVLVPRVYVVTRKGDIDGQGALLGGKQVNLVGDEIVNQGTIAGRDVVNIDSRTIQNLQGRISGGLVALDAEKISNLGGQIDAEKGLAIKASKALHHESTTQSSDIHLGAGFQRQSTNLDRKAVLRISGDGDMMIAAKDIHLKGAEVVNDGQGNTYIQATNLLNMTALETGHSEKLGTGDHRRTEDKTTSVVSVVQGKGNVTLTGNDIYSEGAELTSNQVLALLAKNSITLDSATDTKSLTEYHRYKSGSAVSKKTKTIYSEHDQSIQKGSLLSGNQIYVQAQDITATGSHIVADNDVTLMATNNLDIKADTNTYHDHYEKHVKQSGVFSSGGLGITIGSRKESHRYDEKGTTQSDARATIGSLGGDVHLVAGNHANILGTDLIVQPDKSIHVTAKTLKVEAGKDIIESTEEHKFKQSGLTVALSSPVTDMAMKARDSITRSQQVQDSRLKTLYEIKAAQEGVLAAQEASKVAQAAQSGKHSDFKVSVSVGEQKSESHRRTTQVIHQGSTLSAGHVNLMSTEGDLEVIGSSIRAGNATLDAAGNLSLLSIQDTMSHRSDNKNSGWSAGVFVGQNGGSFGIGVEGSVQAGKGHENSDSVKQINTVIQADKVTLRSGQDTNLKGAVVNADRIQAEVGRHLTIESRQDEQHYASKHVQAGVSASVAIYGSGAHASMNANLNKGKLNYAQVEEQSGLHAGKDGLELTIQGNTHLKGGIVDSQATADKNRFSTGTLTTENIHNYSEVKVENIGGGFSTDMSQNMANGVAAGLSALGSVNKSDNSTTYSAIGPTIYLTVDQGEIPTGLSRDTQNANAKTERFDMTEVRERQEMAQVIGDIANNSVAIALKPRLDKAEQDKKEAQHRLETDPNDAVAKAQLAQANAVIAQYGQGSDIQMAVRAVTGVLQGMAMGNAGQAVVGGLSPYANKLIKEATTDQSGQVNKEANLMAHALLGAVEAYATGNHVVAGAAGAVSGELAVELLTKQLYHKKNPDELSEAQKQTVTALSQLASGLAGGVVGDSTSSAIGAAEIGKRAVEDNYLSTKQKQILAEEIKICNGKFLCELKTEAYWSMVSAGQNASFAAGVLAGVPAVLYEAVSDIASVVLSPMETIDALSTFVSQDDMFDSVAEGIKQDYLARLEHFRQEYERAGAGGSFNAGVEVGKLVTEAASMAMGGAGITKTSATALSKGISNSVQIGMHQVHRVTNWNAVRHVVDTSQVAEATSNGFINAQKVRDLAYVLKPTNELEKKLLDDIVSSGDLTGSKTEQLFNSLAERSGYKVLDGGKYRANNGFDHVWQAKDGSIVIVDSKQLRNGALQVSTKGAGGTNQLSKGWIEAVEDNLPTNGEVKRAFELVRKKGLPVKTIIVAVDKSDKTVKIIPVKIPNKSK